MAKRRASTRRGSRVLNIKLSPIGRTIDSTVRQLSAAAKKRGVTATARRQVRDRITRLKAVKKIINADCKSDNWTFKVPTD